MIMWVALLFYILKFPSSQLAPGTATLTEVFGCFTQFFLKLGHDHFLPRSLFFNHPIIQPCVVRTADSVIK
jgi:hypothetical protein